MPPKTLRCSTSATRRQEANLKNITYGMTWWNPCRPKPYVHCHSAKRHQEGNWKNIPYAVTWRNPCRKKLYVCCHSATRHPEANLKTHHVHYDMAELMPPRTLRTLSFRDTTPGSKSENKHIMYAAFVRRMRITKETVALRTL